MQNEKRQIKKLVWSSHDRQNLSDDSSSYDIQFDQISDISQFILRKAYIPLSTSTFQQSDDDKQFNITSVSAPLRIRNTSQVTQYMNFAYYTPPPLYGYGTINPNEGFRVRLDGLMTQKNAPQTQYSIALRIFNTVSETNNVSYLQTFPLNTSITFETLASQLQTHCSNQTSLQGYILNGLRFCDQWQQPFNSNLDAKNELGEQSILSHPDQDDLGRDVIYFYNKNSNQDFNFIINVGFYYWNSLSSKYDIPIDKASVVVNMNSISTKNNIGTYIYGIRPPSSASNYDTEVIGFQTNTVYTNASLITWLNSQVAFNRFGITFSKVQIGGNVNLDKMVITSTPNTGYRRLDPINDVTIFRRLGFRYKSINPITLLKTTDFVGPWDNSPPIPLENLNIYYEIRCNNVIQIFANQTNLWSDLITQGSFIGTIAESGTGEADYQGLKINLEIVKDPNTPVVPNYFSVKMSSTDPNCQKIELRIDDNFRPVYVPTEGDYFYKATSPNQGLIFQPYITNFVQTLAEKQIWWPNVFPDEIYVSFDTTVYYTESSLLSTIQLITTTTPNLIFSLVNHKLVIQNTSETKQYLISSNDRLGIPEDINLPFLTTLTMTHDIDLSSLNDVVYIGLSLYSDGSNGVNKNIRLTGTPNQPRPQRKNIVASIVNTNDTNYGKYLVFDNQTDDWMKCDRTDFSNIHVDVYDSEYNLLNLNGITTHFSIIFR